MELSVASLIQSGSYSPAKPERREISWINPAGDTCKATVFIRKKSFATAQVEADNFNRGVSSLASRLISSIVDENGNPLFEIDDIMGNEAHGPICDSLGYALYGAINEVNGIGLKTRPKSLTADHEFWHELVLAGVGGRTIEEAQQNLSHREVIDWIAYRAKFGPLSIQARQERIAAAQMHHLNTIHGGKAKFEDFMLFSQLDEAEQPEATVDDVLMMLKASAIKKQTD